MSSPLWGGGVNLVSSTSADASGKEVTSADFIKSDIQSNLLNYTTNRILEIPQDIKLELNNGTLTLKAGSKVYIPNGFETDGVTPKFDIITLTKDLTYVEPTSNALTLPLFVSSKGNSLFRRGINNSGKTVPDNYTGAFYNLTANKMESYNNGSLAVTMSLPVCVCTNSATTGNNIVSIEQVFNGFGYIGSTVFALPSVKGLISNGRDINGNYKNLPMSTEAVKLYTFDGSNTFISNVWIDSEGNFKGFNTQLVYDIRRNEVVYSVDSSQRLYLNAGRINIVEGKIKEFNNPYVPNFNTYLTNELASMSMPSSKYINLTFGASDTEYTAPANGWFYFLGQWVDAVPYLQMRNMSITPLEPRIQTCGASTTGYWGIYMSARIHDVVKVFYNTTPQHIVFAFIYAQGEQ